MMIWPGGWLIQTGVIVYPDGRCAWWMTDRTVGGAMTGGLE